MKVWGQGWHVRQQPNERKRTVEAEQQDAIQQPASEQEATGRRSGQQATARCEAEAVCQEIERRWQRNNRGNATTSKGEDMVEVVRISGIERGQDDTFRSNLSLERSQNKLSVRFTLNTYVLTIPPPTKNQPMLPSSSTHPLASIVKKKSLPGAVGYS